MVNIKRWLRHAFMPPWRWRVLFSKKVLDEMENAIKQSERRHRGELCFAVENALELSQVWRGLSARQRAIDVFSNLRVWDTEENSGVLIYLLLADREIHIVADRGITKRVQQAEWDAVAEDMQKAFERGDFLLGILEGIERVTQLLAAHFPSVVGKGNELPDKPVIINR
ncbi:MAG: TPM domain-containing protein [Methylobacter sp.]